MTPGDEVVEVTGTLKLLERPRKGDEHIPWREASYWCDLMKRMGFYRYRTAWNKHVISGSLAGSMRKEIYDLRRRKKLRELFPTGKVEHTGEG